VDDNEAVSELIAARLLSFGGIGFAGRLDPSTDAYHHLRKRGEQALPLIERVLDEGTPAGRAYAATLLKHLDEQAGNAAWERLAGEPGEIRFYSGCISSGFPLAEYARRAIDLPDAPPGLAAPYYDQG